MPGAAPLAVRENHTATLLPDGTVLLAGGFVGDTAVRSTELFDPRTGVFSPGPDLKFARANHTATLLSEGRVLIVGGAPGEALCEIYEPERRELLSGPTLNSARSEHTATLLDDGRVVIVGGTDGGSPSGGGELYDPETAEFTSIEVAGNWYNHGAALLPDGHIVLNGAGHGVYDVDSETTEFPMLSAAHVPTSPTALALPTGDIFWMGYQDLSGFGGFYPPGILTPLAPEPQYFPGSGVAYNTVTLLPTGMVLTTGGFGGYGYEGDPFYSAGVMQYDPVNLTSASAGLLGAQRWQHTATLLPTGSVFVVGGGPGADLLTPEGAVANLPELSQQLFDSLAVTLANGRVLVYEGAGARVFSPEDNALVPTGVPIAARRAPAMVLLQSGKVLLAGGFDAGNAPLATSELFDPSAAGGVGAFEEGPELAVARGNATATLLPDGRVLVAGGFLEGNAPTDSFEIADAAASSFGSEGTLASPRAQHAASLLLDGRVLLVGGEGGVGSAETFDPTSETSSPVVAPLNVARVSPTATLLPSGRVLIVGGTELPSFVEQFHPGEDTFIVGPDVPFKAGHTATLLSSGRVLVIGGTRDNTSTSGGRLFDPAAGGGNGVFVDVPIGRNRHYHAAAWLHSGGALVANGRDCFVCPGDIYDLTWNDGAAPAARPVLGSVPAEVTPGADVAIEGTNFRGLSESSSGRTNASPTNYPIAVWRPLSHGGLVYGSLRDFSPTSATWRVPATTLHGPGLLSIAVNGALSDGVPVTIAAAPLGVGCEEAAECDSGFCVDGVCCDGACQGACVACSAERKGSGDDGECGSVPPERYPDDLCALGDGAACTSAEQCVSGHCADGVCCDAECSDQCEACDVEGSFGQCVAVRGEPHGARPACGSEDGGDVCASRLCDGKERSSCDGFVGDDVACSEARCVDRDRLRPGGVCGGGDCAEQDTVGCAPYACRDGACVTGLCASEDDCHSDYTCAIATGASEGQCVPRGGTSCVEEHLLRSADGTTVDCAPYRCDAAGTCLPLCRSSLDCTRGNACDSEGNCVPDSAASRSVAACGCRAVGSERSPSGGVWLALLLALPALSRRYSRRRAAAG
ncbi:MAG TPA: kelch repeat-containing protein [Polyangiaceae bacterium]|nr:kelch repeat-containing protein [Polyangiaceae bacterium]